MRALSPYFTAPDGLSPHDDAALGEIGLLADLRHHVPLLTVRADKRGRDELRANVRFGERILVHCAITEIAVRRFFGVRQIIVQSVGLELGVPVSVSGWIGRFQSQGKAYIASIGD